MNITPGLTKIVGWVVIAILIGFGIRSIRAKNGSAGNTERIKDGGVTVFVLVIIGIGATIGVLMVTGTLYDVFPGLKPAG